MKKILGTITGGSLTEGLVMRIAPETVLETIEWYKNYQENNKNMKEFSICQINKYFMKIKEKNLILERKEE